jgi:ParB family chromosome partitioning protein
MSKNKSFSIGEVAKSMMTDIVERVETTEVKAKNDIREININKIKPSDKNTFGMRDIEKLAESIKEYGQLENAVVRKIVHPEYEFEMISGHRRQEAIRLLGQETILCKVVEADDLLAEAMLIIANLETRELSDFEKSNSAVRLVEIVEERRKLGEYQGRKTREVVAEMMSTESEKVSPAKVQKLLKVQDLIPEFKEQLDKGELSLEKANQLAQMTPEQQKMVFDMFEQQGKELTAKKAKELKDSLQNSDNSKEIIEKMKKELEEKQEELQKANEKLKEVENQNANLSNILKDFEEKISEIEKEKESMEKEYNKKKEALEKEIEEKKKELESEQKAEIEKATKEKILELEEALKKLQEEEKKKRTQQEEEIKSLKQKLEEKEKEKKETEIKEINIVGNMEIKALAEQARKVLQSLTQKIAEYSKIEGFEITEEVEKVLKEIAEYENM